MERIILISHNEQVKYGTNFIKTYNVYQVKYGTEFLGIQNEQVEVCNEFLKYKTNKWSMEQISGNVQRTSEVWNEFFKTYNEQVKYVNEFLKTYNEQVKYGTNFLNVQRTSEVWNEFLKRTSEQVK